MKDDMKDTLAELEQSLAKERELDNKMADQHRYVLSERVVDPIRVHRGSDPREKKTRSVSENQSNMDSIFQLMFQLIE